MTHNSLLIISIHITLCLEFVKLVYSKFLPSCALICIYIDFLHGFHLRFISRQQLYRGALNSIWPPLKVDGLKTSMGSRDDGDFHLPTLTWAPSQDSCRESQLCWHSVKLYTNTTRRQPSICAHILSVRLKSHKYLRHRELMKKIGI